MPAECFDFGFAQFEMRQFGDREHFFARDLHGVCDYVCGSVCDWCMRLVRVIVQRCFSKRDFFTSAPNRLPRAQAHAADIL